MVVLTYYGTITWKSFFIGYPIYIFHGYEWMQCWFISIITVTGWYTINGDYLFLIPNKCQLICLDVMVNSWIVDDKQFKMVFPLMYTTLRVNGCTWLIAMNGDINYLFWPIQWLYNIGISLLLEPQITNGY